MNYHDCSHHTWTAHRMQSESPCQSCSTEVMQSAKLTHFVLYKASLQWVLREANLWICDVIPIRWSKFEEIYVLRANVSSLSGGKLSNRLSKNYFSFSSPWVFQDKRKRPFKHCFDNVHYNFLSFHIVIHPFGNLTLPLPKWKYNENNTYNILAP